MTTTAILDQLKTEFTTIEAFLNSLSEQILAYKETDSKWSISENIQHLILSTKPLAMLYGNPAIMLEKWGKCNRPARSYQEVVDIYLSDIGVARGTTKYYEPAILGQQTKQELIKNFQDTNEAFLNNAQSLSEEELDSHQIPHPLIGLMTCRAFLYFTHYHTTRHFETIKGIVKTC